MIIKNLSIASCVGVIATNYQVKHQTGAHISIGLVGERVLIALKR